MQVEVITIETDAQRSNINKTHLKTGNVVPVQVLKFIIMDQQYNKVAVILINNSKHWF